jgi:membrane-associated phospholipid phosphatase
VVTADVKETEQDAPEDLSPWRNAGPVARHRRRRLLLLTVVAFTVIAGFTGFPTGREVITFWLLATLLAACGGELKVWRSAVVRDWLPLLAVLFAYDLLRGVANEIGGALFTLHRYASNPDVAASRVRANMTEPIDIDRWLFHGKVPTVWLQQKLYTPGVAHWYDRIIMVCYLSHFLVSLVLAVVLWCVNYRLFRSYLATLVTLTLITLATYILVPTSPPWMAGLNGYLPHVDRVVQATLSTIGGETLNSAVEKGAAYSNPVAAMPSLHAAIPMFLLLFFWREVRNRGRVFLAAYALLMAFSLVYAGEHYVTDVLAGWLYAAISVFGVRFVAGRRERLLQPSDSSAVPA